LESAVDRIRAAGLGVAAISYDGVDVLKQYSARAGITFPLLSDPDSAVIRKFGILNETIDKETPFYGIPHPGTYILDRGGVVKSKFFEEDFRVRDTAASIVLRQFGLAVAKHENSRGKHLDLAISASDQEARPGQRLTFSIDVTPGSRMHVYAPGVQGYIPVALTLEPSKAFTPDAPAFPRAKIMNLAAIREQVPVYDAPFQVQQTITLGAANVLEPLLDKDRNVTIAGKFRYQACDDKECFVPETLPVQWTVHILPFDRIRAK
jgi:AhpC/TSA family/Disulphide bond corrector protein DsbC